MNARTVKFLQGSLSLACAAALTFSLRAGNDYYVDAVNGNDLWDGSTAAIPSVEQQRLETVPGPRKTLAGAMAIEGLTSGDTVHAAPGVYNEGGMENAAGSNRVIVAAGVLLVADQGAAVTTIEGKISAAEGNVNGCAADSMRAVYMNSGSVVKGFTVTKGRPNPSSGNSGNGGGVYYGLAVECVFSNNVASYRGNAASNACLLRCRIGSDPAGSYACYAGVYLIDCIYDSPLVTYSYSHAFNTTFLRGSINPGTSTARNCLFLTGNNSAKHYSCISASAMGSGTDEDGKCKFGVNAKSLAYDPATFRPRLDSLAFDSGNSGYYAMATNNWTGNEAWWQSFFGKDFSGGERILGKSIDIGAGEADPLVRKLWIADSASALEITGADKGESFLDDGQTNTFTLSRNYSTEKLLTGIKVNGEFHSFTGETADRTYTFVYGYGDERESLEIEAVYAEKNDWYVNANTDPEKGFVGNDANSGYTKYNPKRTLAGAMSNVLLAPGDVVHAASGVYSEGTMAESSTATATNRVIVPSGVGLVADEGFAKTAIEGFIPEGSRWGSTDPVRGVLMKSGAYTKGFTIRNAMASMDQGKGTDGTVSGGEGGGVYGGTLIDCVVSNCYAVRGGGIAQANLIRCKVQNNKYIPSDTQNASGALPNYTGQGLYYCGSVCDSAIYDDSKHVAKVVNSVLVGLSNYNWTPAQVSNSYIEKDNGYLVLANSIVKWSLHANSSLGAGSRVNTALKFDADGRPDISDPTTAQYAIDKGNRDYYVYPSAFAHEAGKDFAGGQRIYNGQIDIGCGEYDWRGDFERAVCGKENKRLAVDEATANVTTNALGEVTVPVGDSVRLALTLPYRQSVLLALGGTDGVSVTLDGAAVAPENGKYIFFVPAGEHTVLIRNEGAERTAIEKFALSGRGTVMILR